MAHSTTRAVARERHAAHGRQRPTHGHHEHVGLAEPTIKTTGKEAGVLERTGKLLNEAIERVRSTTRQVEDRADATLGSMGEGTDEADAPRGEKAGLAKENEGLAHELHSALNELGRQVDRLGEL